MYLIIVGAGPEGSRLVELALKDGHRVSIIEKDEKRAQAVLQKYNVRVFHAGIAEGGILDEADADTADGLVATTSDDSANLMAMFLGKERGIKTLMSMVNDRHHQAILLLSLAMVVGGASGSTVGGLKLNRLVLLYKGVLWRFRRLSITTSSTDALQAQSPSFYRT